MAFLPPSARGRGPACWEGAIGAFVYPRQYRFNEMVIDNTIIQDVDLWIDKNTKMVIDNTIIQDIDLWIDKNAEMAFLPPSARGRGPACWEGAIGAFVYPRQYRFTRWLSTTRLFVDRQEYEDGYRHYYTRSICDTALLYSLVIQFHAKP